MEEVIQRAPRSYYLKGKWRHWFWPLMAVVTLSMFIQRFAGIMPSFWVYVSALTVFAVFSTASVIIFGLKNNNKTYRTLFILLAVFNLISAIPQIIYMIHGSNRLIVNALSFIGQLSTAVLSIFFAANKEANSLLRAASIIRTAVCLLYILILSAEYGLYLTRQGIAAWAVIENLYWPLGWAAAGFFYGAMSFSKPKQPQAGNMVDAEPKWTPPSSELQ